jgi:hypothetical protein
MPQIVFRVETGGYLAFLEVLGDEGVFTDELL